MTKRKLFIFAAFIITVAAIVIGRTSFKQAKPSSVQNEATEYDEPIEVIIPKVTENEGNAGETEISEDELSLLKEYSQVHVEKIEITRTQNEEGDFLTSYDLYFVTDLDFTEKTENSILYKADENGTLLPETDTEVSAEDILGIELNKLNDAEEALLEIASACGYQGKFDFTMVNTDLFCSTGSVSYVYPENQEAEDRLAEQMDGYDVTESVSSFLVEQLVDNICLPTTFISYVQFEKDGQTIVKSSYLRIEPVMDGESCGSCGCGHADMRECDETCTECGNE